MTGEHCKAIIRNLAVVKAVAEGRDVYFAQFNCDGKFLGWRTTNKVILGSLEAGFYSVKPRYQCIRPGVNLPIPYRHQQEAVNS